MIKNLKLQLFAPLALIGISAHAQMSNVQSAGNSLKFNELIDAKKFIDLAAENEKTANDPKMWFYRGKVYGAINSNKDQKIRDLDPDAAMKSAESFLNCEKTDTRKNFEDDLKELTWVSGIGVYNQAISAYSKGDFEKTFKLYDMIFLIFPYDKEKNLSRSNITPEILYKNIYITALKAKNNAKAKENMQKLIDMKYNDPSLYLSMAHVLMQEKDTTKALAYIEKGRSQFETNTDLITEELNIYILKKNFDVLLTKLNKAIEIDPEKDQLYYQRGQVYERKKDIEKAIADYKKVIELNKDNADAYYNIGAVVYNEGGDIINSANNIKNDVEYQKVKKRGEDKIKEALPFLEKAHEIKPKDLNTLNVLKQVYVRMNNTEKYNQIKAEIEALK